MFGRINQFMKIGLVGLVFLFGVGLLAKEYRATKKMGAVSAPEVGQNITPKYADRAKATDKELQGVNGFVVWSSNRFGNHDILKMELPSRNIVQLTKHPHTEYFARISPDGKRIVFARSHEPWVSQRNVVAWNVYMLDIESGKEKLMAKNASFPSWVDNDSISYLHKGVQLVVKSTGWLGKEKVVYESGRGNKMPLGAQLSTPEYNPVTQQVVFTAKQSQIGMSNGYWGTALFNSAGNNKGSHKGMYKGCQLFFSSDNSYMYQVGFGGDYDKKGNRFVKVDLKTHQKTELFDFNDDYSHIYFPKDSNDGRYMVFGGSREGHEHDSVDYELFLWDMAKSPEYATRLTFHSGNDNWPDVYIR